MRKKNTYIEEININEFKGIFGHGDEYPIITLDIIKYITHFDIGIKEEIGGEGGLNYDRIHKENRVEKKLKELVLRLGIDEEAHRRIFRTFKEFCKNKIEKLRHPSQYFITVSSYHDNFKMVFGYENPIIKDRLHDIITGGVKEKSIYFSDYLIALHPFLFGTEE